MSPDGKWLVYNPSDRQGRTWKRYAGGQLRGARRAGHRLADQQQSRILIADRAHEKCKGGELAADQPLIGQRDIDRDHHRGFGIAAGGDELAADLARSGAAHIDAERAAGPGQRIPVEPQGFASL